jgi:hypothetical protein
VGNEDPVAVADHRKPGERAEQGRLAELMADLPLDKNISGCPLTGFVGIAILKALLPGPADRERGTGLAEAAGIADQKDSEVPRWCCLVYAECDSCGLY